MSVTPEAPPPSLTLKIGSLPEGWQPVSHAILADGTLAIVGSDVDLASEHQRIRSAVMASVAPDPPAKIRDRAATGTARIWTIGPAGWTDGPTFPLETPFPIIDRFEDGRWLVVGARTLTGENARVLAADGGLLSRFMLGDGVEHVAIDQRDRIWVAWFDEGVFGNGDWDVPGQEWPPTRNGIACFAEDGALLDLPVWPNEAGSVADCYALNVVADGSWSCPYLDFPLIHSVPGTPVRWWRNRVAGPKAIAIDGSHALLAGGYGGEASRLALVSLTGAGCGEEAREIARWSLPFQPRKAATEWEPVWERPTLLAGRADAIHLIDRDVWHVWRVAELMPAVATA